MSGAIRPSVAVVGCGVVGLTSGVRLLEAGFAVTIFARERPPHTTSDVAAAFWYPRGADADAVTQRRVAVGQRVLTALAADPASGVRLAPLHDLFAESATAPPWAAAVDRFDRLANGRYPGRWAGFATTIPQVLTPRYMPWLYGRFLDAGGRTETATVDNLAALTGDFSLVVNCAGAWAGQLAEDQGVYPVRGQVVLVERPSTLPPAIVHVDHPTRPVYIVPREADCLLGGSRDRDKWDLAPDPALAADIVRRCRALVPAVGDARILGHRVGLRPGREAVRLELVRRGPGTAVIHNYGHGGVGHTLAWGCAAEVAALARAFAGDGGVEA